jgi:hypothetical protein
MAAFNRLIIPRAGSERRAPRKRGGETGGRRSRKERLRRTFNSQRSTFNAQRNGAQGFIWSSRRGKISGGGHGVTDEVALGIAYEKLDIVLDGIERGQTDEELMGEGLRPWEIRLVREMNRLSEWKRNPAYVATVADHLRDVEVRL